VARFQGLGDLKFFADVHGGSGGTRMTDFTKKVLQLSNFSLNSIAW
jgi:hypothetical protein